MVCDASSSGALPPEGCSGLECLPRPPPGSALAVTVQAAWEGQEGPQVGGFLTQFVWSHRRSHSPKHVAISWR